MPLYDYACKQCGRRFERRQRMSDPPVETCPECGGAAERLVSGGAGVILKGSGSYCNDHSSSRPSCGRATPCCGRDTVCDSGNCKS